MILLGDLNKDLIITPVEPLNYLRKIVKVNKSIDNIIWLWKCQVNAVSAIQNWEVWSHHPDKKRMHEVQSAIVVE